ncbi:MAG: Hpt domain-containing protein [Hyphomicrobiaceae bacterium]
MNATAASRTGEELDLIDQTIIDRYTQRGPKMVGMLVDLFLKDAPRYFQEIRGGIDANDFSAVRVAAHGLKSCSYNLGAIRLAGFCEELEAIAFEGIAADVQSRYERIGPTLFSTEEALKSIKLSAQTNVN